MTTYSVDYLQRLKSAVLEFEQAFNAWMETQEESDLATSRGLFPTVWAKEGADPTFVKRLELDVAETAGSAARAVQITGAYIVIDGFGIIDPIANWALMTEPRPLVSPRVVRMTIANVKGRLGTMALDADNNIDKGVPTFSPAAMHPLVWSEAAEYWTIHKFRTAVREVAEGFTSYWKKKVGWKGEESSTSFWQKLLSPGTPKPGKPKLVWLEEDNKNNEKNMQEGLRNIASGLNQAVRNINTHVNRELLEQEAMEQLAMYSYLAQMLNKCNIIKYEGLDSVE